MNFIEQKNTPHQAVPLTDISDDDLRFRIERIEKKAHQNCIDQVMLPRLRAEAARRGW